MRLEIPPVPLALTLAGALPFAIAALAAVSPDLVSQTTGLPFLASQLLGRAILITYGTVIFAFMSGVIWGFATKSPDAPHGKLLTLSVIPAILVFFYALYAFVAPVTGLGQASLIPLIFGFLLLLILDKSCHDQALAPAWWMQLRLLVTGIVVALLSLAEIFS